MGGKDTAFEERFNMLKDVFLEGFLKDDKMTSQHGGKKKKETDSGIRPRKRKTRAA